MRLCSSLPRILTALHLASGIAGAAVVTLYDGSSAPEAQGWTRLSEGRAAVVTVGPTTTEFNTEGTDINSIGPQNQYLYNTGAQDFVVSINLQVISASWNPRDPGLLLSPAFAPATHNSANDRNNSLAFLPGQLLWSDGTGATHSLDTSMFHEYSMRYEGGDLDIFVDTPMDDIIAGTAVPLMSRPAVVLEAGTQPGWILFGDFTNDAGYNSHYVVDSVTFHNYAVPEPSSALLLWGGLLPLAVRRRPRPGRA